MAPYFVVWGDLFPDLLPIKSFSDLNCQSYLMISPEKWKKQLFVLKICPLKSAFQEIKHLYSYGIQTCLTGMHFHQDLCGFVDSFFKDILYLLWGFTMGHSWCTQYVRNKISTTILFKYHSREEWIHTIPIANCASSRRMLSLRHKILNLHSNLVEKSEKRTRFSKRTQLFPTGHVYMCPGLCIWYCAVPAAHSYF